MERVGRERCREGEVEMERERERGREMEGGERYRGRRR